MLTEARADFVGLDKLYHTVRSTLDNDIHDTELVPTRASHRVHEHGLKYKFIHGLFRCGHRCVADRRIDGRTK